MSKQVVIPLKNLSHGSMAKKAGFKIFDMVKTLPYGPDGKHSATVPFYKIGGFVTKIGKVTTTYGDSAKFGGEFRGEMVTPDGEILEFTSTVAYLPGAAEALIQNAWNGRPQGVTELRFLFSVGIMKLLKTDGTESYEYDAKNHIDIPTSDRVTQLFAEAPELLALEAPKPKAEVKKKSKK